MSPLFAVGGDIVKEIQYFKYSFMDNSHSRFTGYKLKQLKEKLI